MTATEKPAKVPTWTARIVDFRPHDGDTLLNVHLDVGWGVTLSRSGTTPLSVRMTSSAGPINAPETYGPEAQAGKLVALWFENTLRAGPDVWLVSRAIDRDAYGRCIGELHVGGVEVGLLMLDKMLCKRCGPGGVRVPFTAHELALIVSKLGAA